MRITPQDEQRFYDVIYARQIGLPDEAIRYDLATFAHDLTNPARPIYERRLLFRSLLDVLLAQPLDGAEVLDYGCGTGDWGLVLASQGARVTFLDLSPVAVDFAMRRAVASGLRDRVRGVARDASDLTCFHEAQFDLIVACAALHHTIKYPHALEEIVRILKPGGRLTLAETLGNNIILNACRRVRAFLGRERKEAGEGFRLAQRHLELLSMSFAHVEARPMNLLAMAKRVFRGHFEQPGVISLLSATERVDELVLSLVPALRRFCGEVLVVAQK
jgi:SAM-dependent methyltransferase